MCPEPCPVDVEDIYQLTPMQQGMLFQSLLAPGSGVFVEQLATRLAGNFNADAFERAWQAVVDHTAILRTSFHWDGLENPVQVVHREVSIRVERLDWSAMPPGQDSARLKAHMQVVRRAGFDLAVAPLMRVDLIRVSPVAGWFVWHFHHLLLDGWSSQLLLQELVDQYSALVTGRAYQAPARQPFADHVRRLQEQDPGEAERFWRRALAGIEAPTEIGVGKPGAGGGPRQGTDGELTLRFSSESTETLRRFARENHLTLSTLIQGAWALLLSRYSGRGDVLYGSVVSGRPADLPGVESMIGLFINSMPMRVRLQPQVHFLPWLQRIQADHVEALQYQHVSPLELQRWSEFPRGTSLFETLLVFENFPVVPAFQEGAAGRVEAFDLGRTDVALTVMVLPGESLEFKFLFDDQRFDRETIAAMAGHLETLLGQFPGARDARLSALSILSKEERQRIIVQCADTAVPGFDAKPLMQRFEERAAISPEAVAFVENGTTIRLRELRERSGRLARYLIERGVSRGAVVGVCLERSIESVVALLAILEARAAYLPLDPSYPRQRLAHMLEDSGAEFVLSTSGAASLAPGTDTVDLRGAEAAASSTGSACPVPRAEPGDVAYVLYTSGSTGRPKGVAVEHRTILNRLDWMWRTHPFTEGEVGVMRTPLNFVDSFWEMLGGLLQGVPTVIAPDGVARDPAALVGLLAKHRVTRLWFVPSYLEMLLEACPDLGARLPALRSWWSGGEPLSADLCRRFTRAAPDATLFNVYGSSELWDATVFDPTRDERPADLVPIGRPISNTEAYVLDDRFEPVPVGAVGRLYFGGACLARGYVHRADLTAERFVPHPFGDAPGARLYDSGDLARRLPDGSIASVGRRDHQINLRGFRIEPGEIEGLLDEHPAVRESTVLAHQREPGDTRLVAYVVPVGETRDAPALLAHAAQRLPAFMVPASVVWIDAMPKTPSGKRDRRRLLELGLEPVERGAGAAPRNALEKTLAKHFRELLGVSSVGIHDDFFAHLGGHSLLATRLVSRVREELDLELPLRAVFDARTVARLAAEIARRRDKDERSDAPEAILADLEDMSPDEIDALFAEVESPRPGASP